MEFNKYNKTLTMALDIINYLSDNAKSMRRSAIRDLLNVANA